MTSAISILVPALLFFHALWRIYRGGRLRRIVLTLTPSISLAMTTVWLATSLIAVINGTQSAAAQHANATIGPVMALFLLAMVELPFGVHGALKWLKEEASTDTEPMQPLPLKQPKHQKQPKRSKK